VPERAYVEGTLGVYELKAEDLLRDVFVWAYERSCQRYMAIRETLADPDPVRLRYREALIAIVGGVVRGREIPSDCAVRKLAQSLVPAEDRNRVVELALEDLHHLHEGNVTRYRLRLSEFQVWQAMQRGGTR
jgi:hypothetical protein